jgi:isocitrate dehydrogenase kinase/phosphatase
MTRIRVRRGYDERTLYSVAYQAGYEAGTKDTREAIQAENKTVQAEFDRICAARTQAEGKVRELTKQIEVFEEYFRKLDAGEGNSTHLDSVFHRLGRVRDGCGNTYVVSTLQPEVRFESAIRPDERDFYRVTLLLDIPLIGQNTGRVKYEHRKAVGISLPLAQIAE